MSKIVTVVFEKWSKNQQKIQFFLPGSFKKFFFEKRASSVFSGIWCLPACAISKPSNDQKYHNFWTNGLLTTIYWAMGSTEVENCNVMLNMLKTWRISTSACPFQTSCLIDKLAYHFPSVKKPFYLVWLLSTVQLLTIN